MQQVIKTESEGVMSVPLHLSVISFKQGAYITVEGKQHANQFFIIRLGKIRLSKEVEVVAEEGENLLGPGDFFGVVSTMSGHRSYRNSPGHDRCESYIRQTG